MNGNLRNMSDSKREELTGRGRGGKTTVAGVRDREKNRVATSVVDSPLGEWLQGFAPGQLNEGTEIFTFDATAYVSPPNHKAVNHCVCEYVGCQVHTNWVESFCSTLKRVHKGTYRHLRPPPHPPERLHRNLDEVASRHKIRDFATLEQIASVATGVEESRLQYKDLPA